TSKAANRAYAIGSRTTWPRAYGQRGWSTASTRPCSSSSDASIAPGKPTRSASRRRLELPPKARAKRATPREPRSHRAHGAAIAHLAQGRVDDRDPRRDVVLEVSVQDEPVREHRACHEPDVVRREERAPREHGLCLG